MNKLLGVIAVLVLVASFVTATVDPDWDKSTLVFNESSSECPDITATFCNMGADMTGDTTYEVFFSESGNPKDGTVVDTETFPALLTGECATLTYVPVYDGNYMFKAYQRPGHPGQGDLWSDSINFETCDDIPEFGLVAGIGTVLIAGMAILVVRKK
jgi:YqxM protein